ncbi:hypothetical protein V502_10698 [Pseudogymnoascus sp. VKM F-4520 (FW-2644)]|nr:hypothetical protein V502_10698 [Pseudogymnoascus sp. VKM F-4520 (FW-2644)]
MPARNEIPLQLRILSNPVFTVFAIGAIWLLIETIHPQTSTTAHPATIFYGELLDCWNSLHEQHGNTSHCLHLLHSNSSYLNWISLVSKLQARENIALVVLVVVGYSIAIAAIWVNQDYISRAWSLRLVMGVLISAHSHLLGNLLWNQYAPVWLFVLNALLQSLFWDYWTEAGKEIRDEFFIAILRSVRRRFSGTINGKGQEDSADGTKGLVEKSEA